MNYNIITIGYDCSPASVLRELNLRDFALPFDWVVSNVMILKTCIEDNFKNFHKNLQYNHNKSRLVDEYGFQFPHDYPLENMDISSDKLSNINIHYNLYPSEKMDISINQLGDIYIHEDKDQRISSKWKDYHPIILEKYNRRINRFLNIMNDKKPIICLSRYPTIHILHLHHFLSKYYNNNNIYVLNSSQEEFETKYILNINTEINNKWNDKEIWKIGFDKLINKLINTKVLK
jgi:hypothetical protein